MGLIYTPKGPALEYADYALNLYKGCDHQCLYCYAPRFAYMMKDPKWAKEQFKKVIIRGKVEDPHERVKALLRQLAREAQRATFTERILLSFTTDPYQPIEEEYHLTRQAIEILGGAGLKVTVLTKAPLRALKDLELFKKHDVEFAQTICFIDDEKRQKWEPNADPIGARLEVLDIARAAGLKTWVSIEPIMDIEVLKLIEVLIGKTDLLKIGTVDERWNSDLFESIDWPQLLANILELLDGKQDYYIKNHLWKLATSDIKQKYKKTTVKALEQKAGIGILT